MDVKSIFSKTVIIKIFCIVIVSFLIAFVFSGIRTDSVKNCVKDYLFGRDQKMQEKILDFSKDDLPENEMEVISDSDKQSIIILAFNDYVQEVTLNFNDNLKKDLYIEVFYNLNEDKTFSESRRYVFGINKQEKTVKLNIRKKVWDLRIDFVDKENIIDCLKSITLNENAVPFSIGRLIVSLCGFNQTFEFSFLWLDKLVFISIILIFIGICIFFDTKKVVLTIFQYRWLVAGIMLLFLVVNRYNGDSLVMYDTYIQHGKGNEYITPVIGKGRAIRSDEWVVSTPTNLSTQFLENPYGTYNNILRATDTINSNKMAFHTLVNPVYSIGVLLRSIFGYDYYYSFTWYAPIFLTFLFTLELFLIITKNQKLLSLTGTCMIILSSYYLWWGFPVIFLYSHGALVCAYYFFHVRTWIYKILLGYGTGVCTALFVLILYPAWQVPIGYVILAMLVWMIHENWEKIRKSNRLEIIIIIASFLLCIGILASNLYTRNEYISSITQTVYPGKRVDTGGFSINKLCNYCIALLFPFKDTGNPSEAGACISFFPIPTIIALWLWIKSKKKDWLTTGLLLASVLLIIYTTIGLPVIIAKCTLMTYSTAIRAVDILGYIQVLLFIQIFSTYENSYKFPKIVAGSIAIIVSVITIFLGNNNLPNYMPKIYMIVIGVTIAIIMFIMMSNYSKKIYQKMYITIIIVSLITGIYVRPIEKGTEAIYSKPLAKEIQTIVNTDSQSKWLSVGAGIVLPSFMVSCGARTINFVNTYPNMELWERLDPIGKYNEVYNRYAHIILEFTEEETSMELMQADCMHLKLSYKDIILTDAQYIASIGQLNVDNEYVTFSELYSEAGSYIYKIQYH